MFNKVLTYLLTYLVIQLTSHDCTAQSRETASTIVYFLGFISDVFADDSCTANDENQQRDVSHRRHLKCDKLADHCKHGSPLIGKEGALALRGKCCKVFCALV